MSGHQVIRDNDQVTLATGELHVMTVACPAGTRVVGGGEGHNVWTNQGVDIDAEISMPSPNSSTFNTSTTEWTVAWINRGPPTGTVDLAAYAICITAP